jgi:ATP-dependent DNA helicase RecQ
MTIVITPTISLMDDQISALHAKGIRATHLGSTQKDKHIERRINDGEFDIIYTTPERFFGRSIQMADFFSQLISKQCVGLIAIDEVHLVFTWKTFR